MSEQSNVPPEWKTKIKKVKPEYGKITPEMLQKYSIQSMEPSPSPEDDSQSNKAKITKAQWDAYHEKAKWDIQVALRGPDSYYGETLKWYTTSVIRGHVRNVMRVGGTVNKDLHLVILPNDMGHKSHSSKYSWNATHFIDHINTAASWMNIPMLLVDNTLWHDAMSHHSILGGGKLILENSPVMDEALKAELTRHLGSGRLY